MTHEAAGVILFKHIFRIAPQALPLFSFGRVEGAEVNDALFEQEAVKAHATKVVATVATRARKSNFGRPRGPRHRRDPTHMTHAVATAVGMLTKLDELGRSTPRHKARRHGVVPGATRSSARR